MSQRALAHRILDADHLGAERGEEPGRAGAGELAGEVADAEVRECTQVSATGPCMGTEA